MAKLVRIKSELKSNKNKTFLYMVSSLFFTLVFSGVGLGMFIAIGINKLDLHIAFPSMFLGVAFILLAVFLVEKHNYGILNAGVRGEQQTYDVLKKLPKEYTVITNPVIHNRGTVNELDFIVIGKNGVFVIETKNYRGIIKGKISDQMWQQVKHGKNKTYEKEVKNPVKQVHRQGRRMVEMFKDFDITAELFPIVYFVDSRSEIKVTDDIETNVAIINNENDLLEYIVNADGKHTVSESEKAKIIRFFKQ